MGYEDIVFLKRAIREVILSRDPNNIQMLKCFTLENSLQGLCLLLKKALASSSSGQNVDQSFIVTTTVLDKNTGELLSETDGMFDFSDLSNPAATVLFQLRLRDKGLIILDLFQRESDRPAAAQNAATLTEQGSSRLADQHGIAYLNMNLPREDFQYLNYSIVKNMFHEFGHALNIALSSTKYQYLSGARGTTDMIEIPSHFAELYLTDYSFIRQFALVPMVKAGLDKSQEESKMMQMLPIER